MRCFLQCQIAAVEDFPCLLWRIPPASTMAQDHVEGIHVTRWIRQQQDCAVATALSGVTDSYLTHTDSYLSGSYRLN